MLKNVPEMFGCMVFNEEVMAQRLPEDVYLSLRKSVEQGKEIDPSIADTVAGAMKDWALEKGADAVLFGHTHAPCCQYIDGLAIFNPGSISHPRGVDFVSYGMLEVTENGRLIISLFKCNDDGTEERIAMM